MAKVLVTGMSGTGTSTALEALGRRGHRVIDTDADDWSRWEADDQGAAEWLWREDQIARLLAGHDDGHLDAVALLSAPAEVMLARIAQRTDNPFGKEAAERARVLADLALVEPLLRAVATAEIDTSTASIDVVADRLERIAARVTPPRAPRSG